MKFKANDLSELMDVLETQFPKSSWDFDAFDKIIFEWRYADERKETLDVRVEYSYTFSEGEFDLIS